MIVPKKLNKYTLPEDEVAFHDIFSCHKQTLVNIHMDNQLNVDAFTICTSSWRMCLQQYYASQLVAERKFHLQDLL